MANLPPDAQRCTAKSKRSGKRCGGWRMGDAKVCHMHGAGSRKRVNEGTKQDPRTAPLVHGLYAQRSPMGESVAAYQALGEQLYNVDPLTARCWVMLEQMDQVFASARRRLEAIAESEDIDENALEGLWSTMKVASGAAGALQTTLGRLESVMKTRQALVKGTDTITRAEATATLHRVIREARRLCEDAEVEREDIPSRLVDWLVAFAEGEANTARQSA